MLTSSSDTRTLTSRPLTQQQVDSEGQIWFFVSDEAAYIRDLLNNPQINVRFVDTGDSLYVSVCGHAQVLKDRAKAWFPGGLNDPKLSLIKVTIQSAEYWDSSASKMTQFFEMAKAGHHGRATERHGRTRPHRSVAWQIVVDSRQILPGCY